MAELGLSALKSARRDNTDRVMDHRAPAGIETLHGSGKNGGHLGAATYWKACTTPMCPVFRVAIMDSGQDRINYPLPPRLEPGDTGEVCSNR